MTNDAAGASAALTVDARGMRCPWPALRLARAMRVAQDVVLIADDPNAAREVAALAAEQGWRMVVDPKGKPSVSHWEKLAEAGGRALLRFRPETGRTHQLRVHALEGLGFPIVGDPVYGKGGAKDRTMLHAERLVVKRDVKPPVIAEAPFPDRFVALGFAAPEGAAPTRG